MGKENFWLDRRSSRDPSRKGEHIRKPYSAAKIVSISPGAMPPFTLETHTINAKIKPSLWFNSLHQAPALGLYFTSKNLPMGGWEGPSASLEPLLMVHEALSQSPGPPKLDHSPFSPFPDASPGVHPPIQRIFLCLFASFPFLLFYPYFNTETHSKNGQ